MTPGVLASHSCSISVTVVPGETALTRMPSGPYAAADAVRLLTARFMASYAGSQGSVIRLPTLEVCCFLGPYRDGRPLYGITDAGDFARTAADDLRATAARYPAQGLRAPLVGPVSGTCDALDITDRDQRVIIHTAEPGSRSEEALRLLSVVGTQRMDVPG